MPLETYMQDTAEMFEAVLKIVESKRFVGSESTSQLLVKTLLDFAERDDHVTKVYEWFSQESLCEVAFTKEIQHQIVKTIFSSVSISAELKAAALERMRGIDDSD